MILKQAYKVLSAATAKATICGIGSTAYSSITPTINRTYTFSHTKTKSTVGTLDCQKNIKYSILQLTSPHIEGHQDLQQKKTSQS